MTTMRRVLAVSSALVLAAFGAFVLVSYVRSADARAEAGAVLVPVLVVEQEVPAGTAVADLGDKVSTEQVPQRLVATGALRDLSAVDGLTTTVDLLPGEQVMAGRFADPTVQAAGEVVAPAGTQQVSVTLEPQRAVGGVLAAGDQVGVYVTSAGVDVSAPAATDLVVGDVLVVRVSSGTDGTDLAGTGSTETVTLALTQADAERVITGAATGNVWLSLQQSAASADTSVTSTTTPGADK
jgi:pilus assembly protein CpaB